MNENDFINSIVFKKYKSIKLIGKGAFGCVYLGLNIIDKSNVAIKYELRNQVNDYLENEAYMLYLLKGVGIPKLISFGRNKKYNILIEILLGKSIHKLLLKYGKKLSMKDCCMMGVQMLDRLEFIHSKYVIHRDIKPDNFLIEKENESLIYIIDFGLAKKYMSSRTGKHVKFSINKKWSGTPNFASCNVCKGIEPSRRDDLESLFYVLLYIMKGSLPWQKVSKSSTYEEDLIIYNIKKYTKSEIICKGLPKEIILFFNYCRSLAFEQNPNYNYLRSLLLNILNNMSEKNDLCFCWIKTNENINKKEINSIHTRKNSAFNKLLIQKRSKSYEINNNNNGLSKNDLIEDKNKELIQSSSARNLLRNNINTKNNEIIENKSPTKVKSKISIHFSELISFGDQKFCKNLRLEEKIQTFDNDKINNNKNNNINNNNIYNSNNTYQYSAKGEDNGIKKNDIYKLKNENIKYKNIIKNNISKENDKKKPKEIKLKLLNSTDFWGDNSNVNMNQSKEKYSNIPKPIPKYKNNKIKRINSSNKNITNYINNNKKMANVKKYIEIKRHSKGKSPINFNTFNLSYIPFSLQYKK